jgi:uncharacterized membrane protein HdeD (DUF308 family)
MLEILKILIGIFVLAFGIPLGNFLARSTKEELNPGHKYFIILTLIGLLGGLVGLVLGDDVLMFTMFFIAIVTSRSVNPRKVKRKKK